MITEVIGMMDEVFLTFAIAWIIASVIVLSICMYRYYIREGYKK